MSLKTHDEEDRTDLWIGKVVRSEARTMISASLESKHSGRGEETVGELRGLVSVPNIDSSDSACKSVGIT